jgi:hypothetical protein
MGDVMAQSAGGCTRRPISSLAIVLLMPLAKDTSAPLFFKGDDFGQTDVMVASY